MCAKVDAADARLCAAQELLAACAAPVPRTVQIARSLRRAYPLEPLPAEFVQLGAALARKLDQQR